MNYIIKLIQLRFLFYNNRIDRTWSTEGSILYVFNWGGDMFILQLIESIDIWRWWRNQGKEKFCVFLMGVVKIDEGVKIDTWKFIFIWMNWLIFGFI